MTLSACAACSYVVRNRLARCQTIMLTIELLLLVVMGHHELAFVVLFLTISVVLLAFFAGMCDLAVTLTRLTGEGHENTLELGAGFIDSLQKSPFHARAIGLAIQSYQRYVATATSGVHRLNIRNGEWHFADDADGGYADVVLKVPALRNQLRACHYFVNFMVTFWVAVVSCYSIFALASVPPEKSRLPHIYAVFAVFMLIAFFGIVDAVQVVVEACCLENNNKRQMQTGAAVVAGAIIIDPPKETRTQHERQVLEFIDREERAKLEGTLESITLASDTTAASSLAIAETVDRMQHHVKLRTGPVIE